MKRNEKIAAAVGVGAVMAALLYLLWRKGGARGPYYPWELAFKEPFDYIEPSPVAELAFKEDFDS